MQSQRDCVLQPKVAVLRYLGTSSGMEHNPNGVVSCRPKFAVLSYLGTSRGMEHNPNGVVSCSPRLLYSAILGPSRGMEHNPNGVVAVISKCKRGTRRAATLSGLELLSLSFPKVAEYGNLGLVVATLSRLPCSTILGSRRQWRGNRNTVAYQSHT